jgi:hypothetical protein
MRLSMAEALRDFVQPSLLIASASQAREKNTS